MLDVKPFMCNIQLQEIKYRGSNKFQFISRFFKKSLKKLRKAV